MCSAEITAVAAGAADWTTDEIELVRFDSQFVEELDAEVSGVEAAGVE